jgi:hypothetical protein
VYGLTETAPLTTVGGWDNYTSSSIRFDGVEFETQAISTGAWNTWVLDNVNIGDLCYATTGGVRRYYGVVTAVGINSGPGYSRGYFDVTNPENHPAFSSGTSVTFDSPLANVGGNVSLGYTSNSSVSSGANTVLGYGAGSTITTGSNLTVVGYDAEPSSPTATNEATLGNSTTTRTRLFGALAINEQTGTAGQVLTSNGTSAPTWQSVASSGGDVAGPASSTDNAIARFDGTTGKIVQNSTATVSDTGDATFKSVVFNDPVHGTRTLSMSSGRLTVDGDFDTSGTYRFGAGWCSLSGGNSTGLTLSQLSGGTGTFLLQPNSSGLIEMRNGTNPITTRIYNTYTDGSNYERGFFRWNTNVLEIGTEAAGTGTARNLKLSSAGGTTEISGSVSLPGGTANGVIYLNSSKALTSGSALTFDGSAMVLNTSTTSDALRITQTGTGNALLVEDSSNPDSTPFVIDAGGNVVIGNTTTSSSGVANGTLQIQGSGVNGSSANIQAYSASTGGTLEFDRSRGALGAQSIVSSGDRLGRIFFNGSDGTSFIRGAEIFADVDGTPGTNDMPGRLVFSTTRDGASTPTEAIRINSNQLVQISNSLDVNGVTVGRGAGAISTNTAVGTSALGAVSTGNNSVALGYQAAFTTTQATQSVYIGSGAGYSISGGNTGGVYIGYQAGNRLTTGANYNVAIGHQALYGAASSANTTYNIAIGNLSIGSANGGSFNIGLGNNALSALTTGAGNIAVGGAALVSLTTGTGNLAVGTSSGDSITTGSYNAIFGRFAGNDAASNFDIRTLSNFVVLADNRGVANAAYIKKIYNNDGVEYSRAAYISKSAAYTLTAIELTQSMAVATGAGGWAFTLPTHTGVITELGDIPDGWGFDFTVINTASGSIGINTATGYSFIGSTTILAGISATYRFRYESSGTWTVLRIR